jgi:thiaminase
VCNNWYIIEENTHTTHYYSKKESRQATIIIIMKTTGATSAEDFWNAAKPLIDVTEHHPFLVSMVDGTLALENFRYYVIQDALYLQDFADCLYRLGDLAATVTAAQRQQERNKVDAKNDEQESTISTTISHHSTRLHKFGESVKQAEMELHKTFFQQWDISGADGGVDDQKPNTLLYTSYMKRIVATRPYAEGLATLLPCFWVYMHVGKCMLQLREKLGDSYVCLEWILVVV